MVASFALTILSLAPGVAAQGIRGSKHDLSGMDPSWFGPVRDEVCIFCHTPHRASQDPRLKGAPLWNRFATNSVFTPYRSSTMSTQCPAAPGPMSLVCLSCHDGATDAGGGDQGASKHSLVTSSSGGALPVEQNCEACHQGGTGSAKLWVSSAGVGTDLTNDHPISMTFPSSDQNPAIKEPPAPGGWPELPGATGSDLRLFNGRLECPTCHNVHSPAIKPFLRRANDASSLCLTCHIK